MYFGNHNEVVNVYLNNRIAERFLAHIDRNANKNNDPRIIMLIGCKQITR